MEEDKIFWVNKEAVFSTYVAAINEEPVVTEYDYAEVAATIAEVDEKNAIIKHALNVTNANARVQVGGKEMSIGTILSVIYYPLSVNDQDYLKSNAEILSSSPVENLQEIAVWKFGYKHMMQEICWVFCSCFNIGRYR